MLEMNTHQATARRFKVAGRGKLQCRKQGPSHLRRKKSRHVLRSYRQDQPVAEADRKRVRQSLGSRKRKK